jgi:hypothetical protein
VKLVRQSLRVLKIAFDYAFRCRSYLKEDHSGQPGADYTATVVFDSASAAEAAP